MGLFSGSVKTYVSSTSYNLAGDEELRPQYLKTLVIQNIISDQKTLAKTFQSGYLGGPGISFRSYFHWAERNYGDIGMPEGIMSTSSSLNMNVIAAHIPVGAGESAWAQEGFQGPADYGRWAEQYVLEHNPAAIGTDYTAEIDDTHVIKITYVDLTTVSFLPTDFDPSAQYLFTYYSLVKDNIGQGLTTGTTHAGAFPSVVGWIHDSHNTTPHSPTLNVQTTVFKTYSDGRPDETTVTNTSSVGSYTSIIDVYHRDTFQGDIPGQDGIQKLVETMYLYTDFTVVPVTTSSTGTAVIGGVTVTTTTTVITDTITTNNTYRTDSEVFFVTVFGQLKLFIYKIGSGIADLDNSVQQVQSYGRFFPFIPIRLNNNFISDTYKPDVYTLVKKAYKKATAGGKLDTLIDKVADNASIDDIDFAYIVYGVSLNVLDKSARKYLYSFFTKLMSSQIGGPSSYDDWVNLRNSLTVDTSAWVVWRAAQSNVHDPLYGAPEPAIQTVQNPTLPSNHIRITNTGPLDTDYDIRIEWNFIHAGNGVGLGKPGAKVNDYWLTYEGDDEFETVVASGAPGGFSGQVVVDKIRVWHQVTATGYEYLDVFGLVHRNYVYNGKYVEITSKDALTDDDETGFVVPLHFDTFTQLPLTDSTQMSTACTFIIFNSFQIVKQKWYETGFFKIILVVVIAVVSAVFTGGAGIGLLGTSLAVGTALGFSGLSAIIIGAVANALAAVILSTIISKVSVGVFGAKFGAIIGAIITLFAFSAITSFQSGIALNWGSLMKVDNIMGLMDAAGKGYAAIIQGKVADYAAEGQQLQDDAAKKLDEIKQQYKDIFGDDPMILDPLILTSAANIVLESGDTFLTRTLMTGNDVADMSTGMLNDFAKLTLTLPDAYT